MAKKNNAAEEMEGLAALAQATTDAAVTHVQTLPEMAQDEVLNLLLTAISERKALAVRYSHPIENGYTVKWRALGPFIGVYEGREGAVIIASDSSDGKVKSFRLDRIQAAELGGALLPKKTYQAKNRKGELVEMTALFPKTYAAARTCANKKPQPGPIYVAVADKQRYIDGGFAEEPVVGIIGYPGR